MRFLLVSIFLATVSCKKDFRKNNLSSESSPYLKISISDKIWWNPWNQDVLDYAQSTNRLIFLSIGYASCFACEKMHQRVYLADDFAEKLNESFVAIKVDREERPDIDAHFLNQQSLIQGFGSWPIVMILTPDLKPVFATTAIKKNKLIGFLTKLGEQWKKDPSQMITGAERFLDKTQEVEGENHEFSKDRQLISDFYARYTHVFDPIYGGKKTGRQFQPKFPFNDEMRLLLRYHIFSKEPQPRKMVEKTLATIAQSGLFDQLRGGFHRYSSSRDWSTPNFEKLLADQASFLHAYIDLYNFKKIPLYLLTMQKTINYLFDEMLSPIDLFYSSQNGSHQGKDGVYYTWTQQELTKYLSREELKLFNNFYHLNPPVQRFERRQVLRRKTTFQNEKLKPVEQKLLKARKTRLQPAVDKKSITSDNAYVISALARVTQLAPSQAFENKITHSLDRLINQHQSIWGQLYHQSYQGRASEQANLDDFAFLIDALIETYQLTFDQRYLLTALDLQHKQVELFYDSNRRLFRFNQATEKFLAQQFILRDQMRPSGQSMSYWNLIRLSRYFHNNSLNNMANDLLNAYPDSLQREPLSYSHLLLALDFQLSKPKNLIIVGSKKQCQKYMAQAKQTFFPYVLFSCSHNGEKLPLHKAKESMGDGATFYICDERSCLPAQTDFNKAMVKLTGN